MFIILPLIIKKKQKEIERMKENNTGMELNQTITVVCVCGFT